MDDESISVVIRSQGEYSDRHETCVCWFPAKAAAQSFIERASRESRDAAQRWRVFEDKHAGDVPDADYQSFVASLKLLDKTFDPTGYDADYASYYMREVRRGEL